MKWKLIATVIRLVGTVHGTDAAAGDGAGRRSISRLHLSPRPSGGETKKNSRKFGCFDLCRQGLLPGKMTDFCFSQNFVESH